MTIGISMTVVYIDRMPLHRIHQDGCQQRQLAVRPPESDPAASLHFRDKPLDDRCDVLASACDAYANQIQQAEFCLMNQVLGEFFE